MKFIFYAVSGPHSTSPFSTLTRIDRAQRRSMLQKRQAQLVMVAFERNRTEKVDLERFLRIFSKKRLANCSCTEQNHKHSSALLLRFDSVICFLVFIMLMVVVYFFMFSGGRLLGEDWLLNFVFYVKESVPIFFP